MSTENSFDPAALTLSSGPGTTPEESCLQQKVALVHAHTHGYLDRAGWEAVMTDQPCWQNQVLNVFGVDVNDRLKTVEGFARLDRLTTLRLAAATRRPEGIERRINARLLCWLARKVLHLVNPRDRAVCEKAIATREAWLAGDATEQECGEATAGAAGAARAAWWAARAAAAAWTAGAAGAAAAAAAAGAAEAAWTAGAAEAAGGAGADHWWIDWLVELIDQWEKACAEEGAGFDDDQPWRDLLEAEKGIVVEVGLSE